ncbi:MAG: 2-amino-4-hydroxy-6-hydroxymethyldihydropteridine diphosphokinase [Rhodothermales bacterium]
MGQPSDSLTVAYLALGSNLGDRPGYLRGAAAAFRDHPQIIVSAVSPVYESPAHTISSNESQPPFLNAVLEIQTSLDPIELLELCQGIERRAGRERTADRWAPRTLDLDVLIFGKTTLRRDGLTIPHPRIAERAFVLRPLADIAPDLLVPPPYSASVRHLLEACPDLGETVRTEFSLLDAGKKVRSRP